MSLPSENNLSSIQKKSEHSHVVASSVANIKRLQDKSRADIDGFSNHGSMKANQETIVPESTKSANTQK